MPHVLSVNLAVPRALPRGVRGNYQTGIDKHPVDGPVEVISPDAKGISGLVGDHIGEIPHHGGPRQAVYAFAREELDQWQDMLGRPLRSGSFGENLTTVGLDVDGAHVGERWRIGDSVELEVTDPRIPCGTFRSWMDERGWVKRFAAHGRPGAYLAVVRPGFVRAGDSIEVISPPNDAPTITEVFRTVIAEPDYVTSLAAADVVAS